jgi:hypothetical protein
VQSGNPPLMLIPKRRQKPIKNITAAAGALVNPTQQEYKKGMTSRKYKKQKSFLIKFFVGFKMKAGFFYLVIVPVILLSPLSRTTSKIASSGSIACFLYFLVNPRKRMPNHYPMFSTGCYKN